MKDSIQEPDATEWLGCHYKTILTTDAANGAMSITESVPPPNSGPPRHIHHDADETFVLLTGNSEFWLESEYFTRGPAQTASVPRGTEHTFRVVSDVPARHLVIVTPVGFEGFFAEMAAGQFRSSQDMLEITEIASKYRLTFTGPPLSADEKEAIK